MECGNCREGTIIEYIQSEDEGGKCKVKRRVDGRMMDGLYVTGQSDIGDIRGGIGRMDRMGLGIGDKGPQERHRAWNARYDTCARERCDR